MRGEFAAICRLGNSAQRQDRLAKLCDRSRQVPHRGAKCRRIFDVGARLGLHRVAERSMDRIRSCPIIGHPRSLHSLARVVDEVIRQFEGMQARQGRCRDGSERRERDVAGESILRHLHNLLYRVQLLLGLRRQETVQ